MIFIINFLFKIGFSLKNSICLSRISIKDFINSLIFLFFIYDSSMFCLNSDNSLSSPLLSTIFILFIILFFISKLYGIISFVYILFLLYLLIIFSSVK